MPDSVAEEVIAEAFRKLGSPYVPGAEGPIKFDCSGLVYWIFSQTGNGALIGNSRKLAAGYARYFSDAGQFSRSFSDAQRGDLICYSENGTHVSHIGIYLGDGDVISALIPPYGVRRTGWNHLNVPFYGVCLVPYGTPRTGPDTTPSTDTDPESFVSSITHLSTIKILYQGDDITAAVRFSDARFVTVAGGVPGEAQLRVRDTEHAFPPGYFHVGGTLELWIDDVRQWDGWVMATAREYVFPVDDTSNERVVPRWWALEGYDRNLLFSRRFHLDKSNPANTFIGSYPKLTNDQYIVQDMAANYLTLEDDGLDIVSGVMAVGPVDPYEPVNIFESGMIWGQSMKIVSMYNGAIFYIDPDRVLRYVDDVTDTAPFALSDEIAFGEIGYRELEIHYDASEMYNEAFVWGAGLGSDQPVFAHAIDEDAVSEHGLFQFGEIVQGVYEQKTADGRADIAINGSPSHNRGHKMDIVRIQCAIFMPGLRVGQGVSFHSGAWDMGDLAVAPGDYTPGPGATDGALFDRFMAQIRWIESTNHYDPHHQNKRTMAMGAYQIMPGNWRVWGPLALGLPRSVGVASRDLDPDLWYPPPTVENQDRVARWRMLLLYQHKGDLRRVAASWKGGPSVGNRDPSTWSRSVLFYVNHACEPLGFPETTNETVLDPLTEPDISRTDYGTPSSSDDVYPVRSMAMTFPTPTSVRFDLLLSHSYDAFWAMHNPVPHLPDDPRPSGDWFSEYITLTSIPGAWDDGPPDSGYDPIGDVFNIACRGWASRGVYGHNYFDGVHEQWAQDGADSASDQIIPGIENAPGIYSAVGRGRGIQNILADVPMNPCGDDAWTNWDDVEEWFGVVSAGLAEANRQFPLELTVAGSPQLIKGYVPSVIIGVAHHGPEDDTAHGSASYGTGAKIGECMNLGENAGDIWYPSDWADRWGQPYMEAEFATLIIPKGTLIEGDWITVSPGWQCQRLQFPGFFCDTSAEAYWGTDPVASACSNRGPECSGLGQSGSFAGTGQQSISLKVLGPFNQGGDSWENMPAPGVQNSPMTYWVDGLYRTLYPYEPLTLEVTWQGITLTRGVELIETDPTNGIFQITGLGSGEGVITVRYYRPAGSLPTQPQPGEPTYNGNTPAPGNTAVEAVIAQAYSMLGVPYQLGAESHLGTDCSGLVYRCFEDAGYGYLIGDARKLAAGYTNYFANQSAFSRSLSSAQRGDLISYSENGVHVSHIGIYLGGGQIISALVNPYGVKKTSYNGISVPFYGVCMVPYDRARTSTDTSTATDTDPEANVDPTGDLPPQTEPPATGITYRPRAQQQLGWGTAWDGQNANMAASAMLLDRHTLGARNDITGFPTSTPPAHRFYSGVTGADSYTRKGTTIADVVHAWDAGWGEAPVVPDPTIAFEYFKFSINEGRGAILHGLATALPAGFRKTNSTDPHALYINEQLPDGTFWGVDPLYGQPMLYPESVLYAYATALADGDDVVTCAFSRRTPKI